MFAPLLRPIGGAVFDLPTPTLIKILNFSNFYQKKHKKLGVYSYLRQRKNYYRSVIASFSGFWTIWSKPAAPGLTSRLPKSLLVLSAIFVQMNLKFSIFF